MVTINCKICGVAVHYEPYNNPDWTDEDRKAIGAIAARFRVTACNPCYRRIASERNHESVPSDPSALAGIPARYRHYDDRLGNWDICKWLDIRRNHSCIIAGPTSIGKTFAACRMLGVEARSGVKCLYVLTGQMFADLLTLRQTDPAAYAGRLQEVEAVTLLLLDDLGKERYTEAAAALLFRLIEHRQARNMRTWITTNMVGDQFEQRLGDHGEAIRRRLNEFKCWRWKQPQNDVDRQPMQSTR